MKKILLSLFSVVAIFSSGMLYAQTFSVGDTVHGTYSGSGVNTIHDDITALGSGTVTMKYHVLNTDFPPSWLTSAAFGICDNFQCRNNIGDTFLWNSTTGSGPYYLCDYKGTQTFDMSLDLSAGINGTHYVTVSMADNATPTVTKTATFIITKGSTAAVQNVNNNESEVKLYPNPARDEINIVYDANAGVKNIAIYNIIGRVMNVYKVTDNNSANLSIDNIPSGIYFVKLYNANGNVVTTKKFTKQ